VTWRKLAPQATWLQATLEQRGGTWQTGQQVSGADTPIVPEGQRAHGSKVLQTAFRWQVTQPQASFTGVLVERSQEGAAGHPVHVERGRQDGQHVVLDAAKMPSQAMAGHIRFEQSGLTVRTGPRVGLTVGKRLSETLVPGGQVLLTQVPPTHMEVGQQLPA
jgi:hypothetical protein